MLRCWIHLWARARDTAHQSRIARPARVLHYNRDRARTQFQKRVTRRAGLAILCADLGAPARIPMLGGMGTACIALGSNLGDRKATIGVAFRLLGMLPDTRIVATASLRETSPVDAPAGSPSFINTAALLVTTLNPEALLDCLLEIERKLGRSREGPLNAPRAIDLDLLLYENLIISTGSLTLPHPRMAQRRFVLEPLAEIAPDAVHPVTGKTIRQLLADLPAAAGGDITDQATGTGSGR